MDEDFSLPGNHSNLIENLKKNQTELQVKKSNLQAKINELKEKQSKIRPPELLKYSLKGVIIHEGTVSYGHYYSYVKINENWFKFNDLEVEQVSEEIVMNNGRGLSSKKSSNCYCLVYLKGKKKAVLIKRTKSF